jgi:hypothetical protein
MSSSASQDAGIIDLPGCRTFDTRTQFITDAGQHIVEDFEETNAAPGYWINCNGPLSSAGSDGGCADPGDVVNGIVVRPQTTEPGISVSVYGANWLMSPNSPSGRSVGPDHSESGIEIVFDPAVSAAGIDAYTDPTIDVTFQFYDGQQQPLGTVPVGADGGRPMFGGASCNAPAIASMVVDPAPGAYLFVDDLRLKQ